MTRTSQGNFTVTTTASQTVLASVQPVQDDHHLPFSNLDLLLPPVDCGVLFCYKNDHQLYNNNNDNDNNDDDDVLFKEKVSVLKKSLAQTLAYFYPFAGQVSDNNSTSDKPELSCDNQGVEFVEAYADVHFCDINLNDPDRSIQGKLVPDKKKQGALAIQVTRLKCGGMVVACSFDHRVADAYSTNMFWVMWAEIASSKMISAYPCFQRSLLSPRQPPQYDPTLDDMYMTITPLALSREHENQSVQNSKDQLVSRIYYVSADHIDNLQRLVNVTNNCSAKDESYKRTKLQCFSSFLWKLVASHACQTAPENASKMCKMGIVVDGRTRLSSEEKETEKSQLSSYFGNVISLPFGEHKSADLHEKPLTWVGQQVQNFLESGLTKEHFTGLIDWVEAHSSNPISSKIYWAGNELGPAFVVSSGLRFPFSEVDYGWGKPAFGSYHFPWKGNCGYVMPMPGPTKNGDWVVYMQLLENQLDFIEASAPNIFQPFSMDLISF